MQIQNDNGAAVLAQILSSYGVTHVFFMDAILRKTLVEFENLGVKRILAHSEKSAAYMADGLSRITGRPSLCMAQSVGAANLAAGLQDAYLARMPVISITGRKPPIFRYRNAYQEINHYPLFEPVTNFNAELDVIEQLPVLLAQAFRAASGDTPRPAHLDVAGLKGEVIEDSSLKIKAISSTKDWRGPLHPIAPRKEDLESVIALLSKSARPILICGTGAIMSLAHRATERLSKLLNVPVATSTGGHGIVPTCHPFYLGIAGLYSSSLANDLVAKADLVVFVGCDTGDQVTSNWSIPDATTCIIQIDADSHEICLNYPAAHGVRSDPRLALEALIQYFESNPISYEHWGETAKVSRARWKQSIAEMSASSDQPIRVERLCAEIGKAFPSDGVLVADTGFSAIWTANFIDLPCHGQSYLRAAGSLGWSFPAALGAKCGAPERPVLCFTGDGALYYHLSDLETAARLNIAIVIVVNNNSGFGQGLANVRELHRESGGNPDEIIRFGPTDFSAVAKAFGVDSVRVENSCKLPAALEYAFSVNRPVLVDVVTDPESRPEPPNHAPKT